MSAILLYHGCTCINAVYVGTFVPRTVYAIHHVCQFAMDFNQCQLCSDPQLCAGIARAKNAFSLGKNNVIFAMDNAQEAS